MKRRAFLKQSAVGVGALAGMYTGVLKADGAVPTHGFLPIQNSGRHQAEGAQEEDQFVWGTNAAVLKSPWERAPSLDEMLADSARSLILNQFYRVAGEDQPATPTECRVGYNDDAIFVLFRCTEPNMSFPYTNLDADWWRAANWHSLPGLPSGSKGNWPPNPDEVDFLIQPDRAIPSYYQFAATPQGLKFGCNRVLESGTVVSADEISSAWHSTVRANEVSTFEASVIKRAAEWLAWFQIPWQTLGGRPKSQFGFLPMRTRWRDGQFSSPVAIDLNECMPVDVLIETHFSGTSHVDDAQKSLCRLPSGILRWQRTAIGTYPNLETCRRIWQMQGSLTTPTDESNLGQRLFLTQRWMDLMMQEGFTPLPRAWGILNDNLTLALFRQKVNAALEKNDRVQAYQFVDSYLSKLDGISRWWFADGSPANLRKSEWKAVRRAEKLQVEGNTLLMRCVAGDRKVDLRLALPSTGGVRIYGSDEGFWRPADLLTLAAKSRSGICSIDFADGKIAIRQDPFSISFYDLAGAQVMQIDANSLAFRFDQDGKIVGVDFRHRLEPNEVIYGFGERYDHFNYNGKVLTLWGTDDWIGNGEGMANTTYKSLPIFHSSKPYMVFANSSYRLRADIGRTEPGQYRLTQLGPMFDYYVWVGAPTKALASYTALTGRTPVPPKWAFEPWMGRGGDAWENDRFQNPVAQEESTALRFAELDIPHSAIYAEGPSALSPELNQFMAARGIRVLGYFYPEIGRLAQESHMPELRPDQLPIMHCGVECNTDVVSDSALSYVDFTNPNAFELCRRNLRQALDLGQAGSMVDYGDMVPDSAYFYDGRRGAEMHNAYYYDYHRTVSQVYQEKRGNDFVLYARGAAPGTQRWVGQFAGDHPANFNGLKHVLTGALNLCACGYSNWGSDLGGYFGFPQPAVYMRWFQFGCFSPWMRPHGTAPRDPWYFGDAAVSNYKFLAWTRENILNYTYQAAVIAHETGIPIMRSMPLSFPGEQEAAATSEQYMFGPDLLVAPVVGDDDFKVVTFPSGVWTSLWDGKTISGPAKLRVDAPLDTIPVYLRPGAIVPTQLSLELEFGKSMTHGRVDALIATVPNKNQDVFLLNTLGEAAKVTTQIKTGGGNWKMENLPEISYLLVYGTPSASSVTVDGKPLPKAPRETPELEAGTWACDLTGNRLVIHLPTHQGDHSEYLMEVDVDINPS